MNPLLFCEIHELVDASLVAQVQAVEVVDGFEILVEDTKPELVLKGVLFKPGILGIQPIFLEPFIIELNDIFWNCGMYGLEIFSSLIETPANLAENEY